MTDAESFLALAKIADDPGTSAANAALAGIAASDAACCGRLGERSRGQDHRDAIKLVEQVEPGGKDAANALARLLALKNDAEYGLKPFGSKDRESALRQARKLTEFARAVLEG
jgi:hypothetical protein